MAAVPHAPTGTQAAIAISATTTSTRLLGGVLPAAAGVAGAAGGAPSGFCSSEGCVWDMKQLRIMTKGIPPLFGKRFSSSRNETVAFHFSVIYSDAMSKTSQESPLPCLRSAGRPKASDVEARMQDLIDAAARLFLANGYTRTSLEAIARAARVAVRTIYVKFGGKAGLLDAVLMSRRDQFFRMRDMDKDMRPSATSSTISRTSSSTCSARIN
jgi:hypothetical protein